MSDRGVAKICRRCRIPLPRRGYWRQLATGHDVPVVPLPDPADDTLTALDAEATRVQALEDTDIARDRHQGALPSRPSGSNRSTSARGRKRRTSALGRRPPAAPSTSSQGPLESTAEDQANRQDLFSLAERRNVWTGASEFVSAVEAALSASDDRTRSVGLAWCDHARRLLAESDPVAHVLELCRRDAAALENTELFRLLRSASNRRSQRQ